MQLLGEGQDLRGPPCIFSCLKRLVILIYFEVVHDYEYQFIP